MRDEGRRAIAAHGGTLVKAEADNLLGVFDGPDAAIKAAVDLQRRMAKRNAGRDSHDQIQILVGLAQGKLLLFEGDMWGEPVNSASKLGEDIAEGGEILVDRPAFDRCKGAHAGQTKRGSTSGNRFDYVRIDYDL